MNDMTGMHGFGQALESAALNASVEIGRVLEVSGSSSQITLDGPILSMLHASSDPAVATAGNIGSHVKVLVGRLWLVAVVRALRLAEADGDLVLADVDFLGEGLAGENNRFSHFRRGVTRYPVPGSRVFPIDSSDLKQMFATDARAHIEIGTVYPTSDVRAALYVDALLGKHFALLGSTGTGKSTSAALLLHRICQLAPNGHIVMIDPHGEYSEAFKHAGSIFDVSNLAMPYWLMNFEEHCEVLVTTRGDERQADCDILAKCLLAARAKNRAAEGMTKLTVDSPVPYLLTDLTTIIQNEMGKLDKAGTSAPYLRLKTKIDEIRSDPRYGFMFSGMLVGDTMAEFLAKVFRLPGDGKPISIIDVSGVPSDIVSVVVAMLSRMVFDYAIWSRGEEQNPVLLVCEEAHRYVPNDQMKTGQAVRGVLERIAKEGRKYGVSLGLITQRPSDLAEGVLSQCGTIIAMRLNNDRDQAFVKAAMPEGARGFLDSISALRNREAIICGEGVSIPIRVAFDDLEADKRPASQDPVFSTLWAREGGETELLRRVIQRWRTQGR